MSNVVSRAVWTPGYFWVNGFIVIVYRRWCDGPGGPLGPGALVCQNFLCDVRVSLNSTVASPGEFVLAKVNIPFL